MAGFAAVTVEIAFDAGFRTPLASATWTDVSDYVEGDVTIDWGRNDELTPTSPATCTVVLDNSDGRFTAGLATGAYFPDVKLDRPLRVTVTPAGGTLSVRFTGYIDSWPSTWPGGTANYSVATVTAVSRLGRLGLRNALQSILVQTAVSNGAVDVFPFDEPPESVIATSETSTAEFTVGGSGKRLRFTESHVTFAGGQYLFGSSPYVFNADFSVAFSFRCSLLKLNSRIFGPAIPSLWGASAWRGINDGQWHRVVVGFDDSAGDLLLYIDNTLRGTASPTYTSLTDRAGWEVFGSIRDACRFSSLLSAGDVTDDYTSFLGGFGTPTDDMLELLASFGDIPSAEVDADAGATNMGGIDTSGLSLVQAFQVVESTEGGVLIDARNGDLRLIGRRARYGTSPVATLDVLAQQIGNDFSPSLTRAGLRNLVVGTNAATNLLGVEIPAVSTEARDQASIDDYGEHGSSVEVNAQDPNEAQAAASWIVANHAEPRPRVPTLSLNPLLFDASDADDLLSAFLGDRVTVTNLPDQAPDASLTFFVEGGTETWGPVDARITWSVSPLGLEDSLFEIDVDDINDATKFIAY